MRAYWASLEPLQVIGLLHELLHEPACRVLAQSAYPHSEDARDWATAQGRGLVALTAQSVADVEFLKPKYFLGRRIPPLSFRIELTSQR